MSIVDKIKQSVKDATGYECLYQSREMINVLADNAEYPIAFFYLLSTGSAKLGAIKLTEQVSVAMFFVDLSHFDSTAAENEKIIQKQKTIAHKWLKYLLRNDLLKMASETIRTERVYDATDTILTGYGVQVDLIEIDGDNLCD